MYNSGSLPASLVIQFGPSKDTLRILEDFLLNPETQIPGGATLSFPLVWIEKNRKSSSPFSYLGAEAIKAFYAALDTDTISYVPLGYSGAPERELSGNLLSLEREMALRSLGDTNTFPNPLGPPVYWPCQPDALRPWPNDLVEGYYCFLGFSGPQGKRVGVFRSPDSQRKELSIASFPSGLGEDSRKADSWTRKNKNTQIFFWEIYEPKDSQKGFDLLSRLSQQDSAKKAPFQWIALSQSLSKAETWEEGPLESDLSTPGWKDHPCRTFSVFNESSKQKTSRGSLFQRLAAFSPSCTIETLPHRGPSPPPDRELIASMLGGATLVGETIEATFVDGLLMQMRGTFGGTRGMGVRSPGMILENRKLYWTIESAFSFETPNSRGLRQISVLSSELFTLSGRAVTDYVLYDNHPGLVIDIRIQYPWIDKPFMIESFLPWTLEIWQYPLSGAPVIGQILPDSSNLYETQPYFQAPDQHSSWLAGLLNPRRSLPSAQISIPGSAWDIPCKEGSLRVRRADSLLYPELVQPSSFFLHHHKDTLSLTVCPTRNYASVPSTCLQGIHEHFSLVAYDPEFEKDVKVILDRELRTQVYPPWIVRG